MGFPAWAGWSIVFSSLGQVGWMRDRGMGGMAPRFSKEFYSRCNRMLFPLHKAVISGKFQRVRELVQNGADVNQKLRGDYTYPLHLAVENGDFKIVQFLVEQGADVNRMNQSEHTPLIRVPLSSWVVMIQEPQIANLQRK